MSPNGNHDRYIKMIDELIVGDLAAGQWNDLRAHVAGCAACRGRYDRVAMAERMLHGGPMALGAPSPATFDRIGAAVLEAAPKPSWQRAVAWLRPTQRWAVGVAAAAAVAVLVPFLARSPSSEFQARGGGAAHERSAGVRAFCIGDEGVMSRCPRTAQLRLTVSNPGRFGYVFLVGFDDDFNPKWYAPRPPETLSVAAPDGVDQPIGPAVKLGVNHDRGKVRVYALFSDSPVSASEIESAADRMREQGRKPSQIEFLPLLRTDVVQKSLVLDVE